MLDLWMVQMEINLNFWLLNSKEKKVKTLRLWWFHELKWMTLSKELFIKYFIN